MVVNPQVNVGQMAITGENCASSADMSSFVSEIKDAVSSVSDESWNIVIRAYLGGMMLDKVIVNAQ